VLCVLGKKNTCYADIFCRSRLTNSHTVSHFLPYSLTYPSFVRTTTTIRPDPSRVTHQNENCSKKASTSFPLNTYCMTTGCTEASFVSLILVTYFLSGSVNPSVNAKVVSWWVHG
jgi:hypothetical protein